MEAQGAIRQVYDRQTDPNERSPLVDPVVTDGVNLRLSGMRERIAQIQEVQTANEESSTEELETLKVGLRRIGPLSPTTCLKFD